MIFDGYPRTAAQAENARRHPCRARPRARSRHRTGADEDALVERITGRFTCAKYVARAITTASSSPRSRTNATSATVTSSSDARTTMSETVRTRMAEYRAKTALILPIYEARGIVARADGMADIDVVAKAIDAICWVEAPARGRRERSDPPAALHCPDLRRPFRRSPHGGNGRSSAKERWRTAARRFSGATY